MLSLNIEIKALQNKFLQTALEHAQAYVKQVKLSVIASNIAAIQLYQKYGFQLDHVEMQKQNTVTPDQNDIQMTFSY